ncbi:MAG: hypothetical protein GF401_06925 [Chitinivibrionales bacterium]|nr:hypothetical protein [Chitinivibrionales bacterium]
MHGKHCRLYDENLVRNIMISTGLTVFEYLKHKTIKSEDEICELVEVNADNIIENTIEDMNAAAEYDDEDPESDEPPPWEG